MRRRKQVAPLSLEGLPNEVRSEIEQLRNDEASYATLCSSFDRFAMRNQVFQADANIVNFVCEQNNTTLNVHGDRVLELWRKGAFHFTMEGRLVLPTPERTR